MQQPGRNRGALVVEQANLIEEMKSAETIRRVLPAGALEGLLGTRMPRHNRQIGPAPVAQESRQE